MVLCGVDRVEEYRTLLKDKKVGLMTNQTGRNAEGKSTIDVLMELCDLKVLFGPEHGVRGTGAAGEKLENEVDEKTGLPIYSLYGDHLHFTEEMLECFDVLVYDIQDVGVRFYTYISSLYNAMEDCAKAGKQVVVLDRPNLIGGTVVEGAVLKEGYESFIGCYYLPVRYGLTVGEFALMVNEERNLGCDLKVVTCEGWKRDSYFNDWGDEWVAPSVALTTFESTLIYPGTCLFEGTNVSEGRGTDAAFLIVGADYVNGEQLSRAFNDCHLPGVTSEPVKFTPTFSKFEGIACEGVRLHVTDQHVLRPLTVGVTLLDLIRTMYPDDYKELEPFKEGGKKGLALRSGGPELLGDFDREEVFAQYEKECEAFAKRKAKFHLYE